MPSKTQAYVYAECRVKWYVMPTLRLLRLVLDRLPRCSVSVVQRMMIVVLRRGILFRVSGSKWSRCHSGPVGILRHPGRMSDAEIAFVQEHLERKG